MTGKTVMQYVNRLVREKVIKHITDSDDLESFTCPHGYKKGSGDIFGMWDMLFFDKYNKAYYFVQICHKSKRKQSIIRHGLLDPEMYAFRGCCVRYFLITYRKKSGRYLFTADELFLGKNCSIVEMENIFKDKTL